MLEQRRRRDRRSRPVYGRGEVEGMIEDNAGMDGIKVLVRRSEKGRSKLSRRIESPWPGEMLAKRQQ